MKCVGCGIETRCCNDFPDVIHSGRPSAETSLCLYHNPRFRENCLALKTR
jgi:hypothetical protein